MRVFLFCVRMQWLPHHCQLSYTFRKETEQGRNCCSLSADSRVNCAGHKVVESIVGGNNTAEPFGRSLLRDYVYYTASSSSIIWGIRIGYDVNVLDVGCRDCRKVTYCGRDTVHQYEDVWVAPDGDDIVGYRYRRSRTEHIYRRSLGWSHIGRGVDAGAFQRLLLRFSFCRDYYFIKKMSIFFKDYLAETETSPDRG